MARKYKDKCYTGFLTTSIKLIRYRNIMLGLPIKHLKTAVMPYGYEIDPDKEGYLRPVQKELEALYYARTLQHRSTYKALAEWVSKETGRPISFLGLQSIFRYRPPLSALLLPLHDRLSIATDPTEETAVQKSPRGIGWDYRKNVEHRAEYQKARIETTRRKEEARKAAKSSLSNQI